MKKQVEQKEEKATQKVKKRKINISSITLLCCLKTTFFTAIICWSKVLEERHLLGYHTTSFSLQNLLMMSKLHVRVLKINSLLNT